MDSNSTQLAAIVADTNELQTDDVPGLIAALNNVSAGDVQSSAESALQTYHLDHLLAVDTGASLPGSTGSVFHDLLVDDGGTWQFTTNSLENGPVATGFSTHSAADVRAEMDSNSTQFTAIIADTNELQTDWANGGRLDLILDSRSSQASVDVIDGIVDSILIDTDTTIPGLITTVDTVVDAIKVVTDAIPDSGAMSSIATAAALATVDSNVDAILVDTNTTIPGLIATVDANVDAILVDTDSTIPALITTVDTVVDAIKVVTDAIPDNGAMTSIATAAALTTVDNEIAVIDGIVDAIKVATDKLDDTVEDDGGTYRFTTNALEQAPTGGSAPTAVQIRQEIDSNSTQLAAIVADTNELQGDWANGGRLDAILDARASQSSVDTVDSVVDAILVDTGTTLPATLTAIAGYIDTEVAAIKVVTDKLGDTVEDDGGTYRFTVNALEQGPTSSPPSAADIRSEIDSNSTQLAAIVADTNELQTDDVPALIAALNNLSQADIRTAVGLAAANLDTQLSTIDTVVDTILVDTSELQTDWADGGRLDAILDARASQTSIDSLLTTALTESYPATATSEITVAQGLYMLVSANTYKSVSGTTTAFKGLDGTTQFTATLDDANDPTSITRAT